MNTRSHIYSCDMNDWDNMYSTAKVAFYRTHFRNHTFLAALPFSQPYSTDLQPSFTCSYTLLTCSRPLLAVILCLHPYFTYSHNLHELADILYLQPCPILSYTLLTAVLCLQPYSTHNHTSLATILNSEPYSTHNHTLLAAILYLQPYSTCSHTLLAAIL